jgi:alpha-tubulin suppressor-like RCC1 family protein
LGAPSLISSRFAHGGPRTPAVARGGDAKWTLSQAGPCLLARAGGTVACAKWGDVDPWPVAGLDHVLQISAGLTHICARYADGHRPCWGDNSHDQFGPLGSTSTNVEPRAGAFEPAIDGGQELVLGGYTSCQRTRGGELWCWGEDDDGQLGHEVPAATDPDTIITPTSDPVPQKVPGLSCVTKAAVGRHHACAVSKGDVWCWGRNDEGQLGDGTTVSRTEPRPVAW